MASLALPSEIKWPAVNGFDALINIQRQALAIQEQSDTQDLNSEEDRPDFEGDIGVSKLSQRYCVYIHRTAVEQFKLGAGLKTLG